MATEPVKVLVVHGDLPTSRLVRESLEAFCDCQVDVTSAALAGFERALQKDYRLYFFDLKLEKLEGPLLYELISTALQYGQSGRTVPAVIFICDPANAARRDDLLRDARVKALLTTPIAIGRLLEKVAGVLPEKLDLPIA